MINSAYSVSQCEVNEDENIPGRYRILRAMVFDEKEQKQMSFLYQNFVNYTGEKGDEKEIIGNEFLGDYQIPLPSEYDQANRLILKPDFPSVYFTVARENPTEDLFWFVKKERLTQEPLSSCEDILPVSEKTLKSKNTTIYYDCTD